MLVENAVIVALLLAAMGIFAKARKGSYALSVLPLLVFPFSALLIEMLHTVTKEKQLPFVLLQIAIVVAFAAAIVTPIFVLPKFCKRKSRITYLILCYSFDILLLVVFYLNLYVYE